MSPVLCLVLMIAAMAMGRAVPEIGGCDKKIIDKIKELRKESGYATEKERRAIVILKGEPGVSGHVTFIQYEDNGPVTVKGTISGLSKGKHGFHVHEKGDLTSGCKSTEGHFNPDKKNHGGPTDEVRHAGDLGNIFAEDNGVADIMITDKIISLVGKYSILGRAVVVHSDADDLGRGGFSDSLTTGHAGTRVACGVIGIQ